MIKRPIKVVGNDDWRWRRSGWVPVERFGSVHPFTASRHGTSQIPRKTGVSTNQQFSEAMLTADCQSAS
jgi:hypothetical protein